MEIMVGIFIVGVGSIFRAKSCLFKKGYFLKPKFELLMKFMYLEALVKM